MKLGIGFAFLCLFPLAVHAALPSGKGFPLGPNPEMTPGSLCERPSTKRYAEGIPYCSRDVDSDLKREIMEEYDRRFGYRVTQMDRKAFKIDHFIPLCMGGSNRADNLWPQHESVYALTDQIEQIGCEKMARGRLRQSDAVAWIREAKLDLTKAKQVLARVEAL
jgi:hypothetical protein